MPDLFDQISDAQAEVKESQPQETRTRNTYTFVFQIEGAWHDATYNGTLSDCGGAFVEEVSTRGVDLDKIRWARGHTNGKQISIHPKNDPEAEAEIKRVLALNPTPQVIKTAG